jgi:hypothetical protein
MIVLLNLNKYVGGGETLVVRLAQYLHSTAVAYRIIASGENCWIAAEATRLGLNCSLWPATPDSVNYQSAGQRAETLRSLRELFRGLKEFRVFTFCMRDLHNAFYFFSQLDGKIWLAHGVYHPEDVLYLGSWSSRRHKLVELNRRLLTRMFFKKSVLFVNDYGLRLSLGLDAKSSQEAAPLAVFAPLPIQIGGEIRRPRRESGRPFRVICISRFVVFKVAAILAIMRRVRGRSDLELLVVGHGSLRFILDAWLAVTGANNISIVTGVGPDQLDSFIDTCDVGYAQGTSILEIAKRGLPVLIAPYSRLRDLFNPRFPTLGVFGRTRGLGALGDTSDFNGLKVYDILECIDAVRLDYASFREESIEFLKEFAVPVVCPKIVDFINGAQFLSGRERFEPPRAPFIKRVARKLLGLLR